MGAAWVSLYYLTYTCYSFGVGLGAYWDLVGKEQGGRQDEHSVATLSLPTLILGHSASLVIHILYFISLTTVTVDTQDLAVVSCQGMSFTQREDMVHV